MALIAETEARRAYSPGQPGAAVPTLDHLHFYAVNAEIIAVGSELPLLIAGHELALSHREMNDLGVEVRFKCIVGDDAEGLTRGRQIAMRRRLPQCTEAQLTPSRSISGEIERVRVRR